MKTLAISLVCFFFVSTAYTKEFVRPDNTVNFYYKHLPASGFDSMIIGIDESFTLDKSKTGKWAWNITSFQQITKNSGYFPEYLYKIGTSFAYTGKDWLFIIGASSYSNHPFASKDELSIFVLQGYNVLNSNKHFLYIGIMYLKPHIDPIGDFPLPFINYTYKSKNLFFSLPFPILLRWKINKKWVYLIAPVDRTSGFSTRTAIKYIFKPGFSLDLEAAYINTGILNTERPDKSQKLMLKYGKTGLRLNAYFITAFIGYAFSGEYYYGKSFVNTKTSSVDIKDSVVFDLAIRYGF